MEGLIRLRVPEKVPEGGMYFRKKKKTEAGKSRL